MFRAENQQLVASSFHVDDALILTFSQGEKEPIVQSDKARLRGIRVVMRRGN